MRDPLALLRGRLSSADIQITENLQGIVVDDLAGERLSKKLSQVGLSACSGTGNRNKGIHKDGNRNRDLP